MTWSWIMEVSCKSWRSHAASMTIELQPNMLNSIPKSLKLTLQFSTHLEHPPYQRNCQHWQYQWSLKKTIEMNQFFNNVTYVPPCIPTVMTIDSSPENMLPNTMIYSPQKNVFVINHLEVVVLTVFNWDKGKHP
ncbi:uncharacterized protein VP01_3629g1, partial [Puccinia sorghi]